MSINGHANPTKFTADGRIRITASKLHRYVIYLAQLTTATKYVICLSNTLIMPLNLVTPSLWLNSLDYTQSNSNMVN